MHNNYQQVGGEHVAVEAQIDLLRRKGDEVVLYERDNLEIAQYNAAAKVSFLAGSLFSQQSYRELRSLVAEERPDVAHVHNVFPLISPSAYTALHDAGLPIVQTVHNFRFLCPNALFYTQGENCERCKSGNTLHAIRYRCYRNSLALSALYALAIGGHRRFGTFDRIGCYVALTSFVANKLIESGLTPPSKVQVVGNFVDAPAHFVELTVEPEELSYVLYIGRLSHEKGVDILVKAMAGLPLQLKIAGSGPEEKALQTLVADLDIKNVEFLGHVSGERKWNLIRNALVTVVPSRWYENLPFVILESFAVGTPVVAADSGSLPYVVKDQITGLLFESENPDSLRGKLLWLLKNSHAVTHMRENAVNDHKQRFSAESHYKALLSIYTGFRSWGYRL